MRLMVALKKYFEEPPNGSKVTLTEIQQYKLALTDEDREDAKRFLESHYGEAME